MAEYIEENQQKLKTSEEEIDFAILKENDNARKFIKKEKLTYFFMGIGSTILTYFIIAVKYGTLSLANLVPGMIASTALFVPCYFVGTHIERKKVKNNREELKHQINEVETEVDEKEKAQKEVIEIDNNLQNKFTAKEAEIVDIKGELFREQSAKDHTKGQKVGSFLEQEYKETPSFVHETPSLTKKKCIKK